jgi:N-acetylmuramoyl-L-alanine amidase
MAKALFTIIGLICLLENVSCISFSPDISLKWYKPQTISIPETLSLAGKKILLDPGHGNQTSGSIGFYGTKESSVNLSVANKLKSLLESHGATVFMTRETDTTTRWPSTSTAREDLAFRCLYRDSIQPDLFVSIHHNGTEDGSRDVNTPKVFYAQQDPDGSLDAAMMINAEFSNLLGLGQSTMQTGNYFILRKTTVPSIIGEPSYLSHPKMEKILKDSAALGLEAMTYFRGIVNLFAMGVPKIVSVKIDSSKNILIAAIKSDVALDPMTTGIFHNKEKLPGLISDSGYTAVLPWPLANGEHTFTCVAGNINGILATKIYVSYTVNRSPCNMIVKYGNFPIGSVIPLTVIVLDSYGFPVKDGTLVIHDTTDMVTINNGIAICYHHQDQLSEHSQLQCGAVLQDVVINANKSAVVYPFQGFITSDNSKHQPHRCLISHKSMLWTTDNNGFFSFLTEDSTVHEILVSVSARGYIDTTIILKRRLLNNIQLSPRSSGILIGKKMVIDPEYGGMESGGVSRSGHRACDITRKVSNYIVSMLEEYGADVSLAREDDHTIHSTERVLKAQNTNADLYILVRSDSANMSPYIIHTPGSEKGKMLSEYLALWWKKESGAPANVREEVVYVLQQTECPAVVLSLCPLNDLQSQLTESWQRIARTIVKGIIDYYYQLGND